MKPIAIAAALALLSPGVLSAQDSTGELMTDITCEEFLELPAADQEMHATALTTARMDEAAGADASAQPEQEAEEDEADSEPTSVSPSVNILSPTVVAIVTICENSQATEAMDATTTD